MSTSTHKKIAVLVSGGGTNLQALIDAQGRGELGDGEITLVIASKPGVYALERAAGAGIEGRVLARKDYDSIAAYSKALADTMTAEGIDLVVLAGFLTIIDEQVYEAFPKQGTYETSKSNRKGVFSLVELRGAGGTEGDG